MVYKETLLDMSTEQYQDLFYNIWLFHNSRLTRYNQIWILRHAEIGEYCLDPKWGNLWI